MSYQVLARKWRPRDFDSVVGQEHVVRALKNALEQQRLHHAYLFTGTRGVGKTTLARILAKALNCETGVSARPCGHCSACVEIDAGRFVDLIEVDAATNTRVEEMRQLLENAVYAPTRGRFKVYVIDEVHQLSGHAFNAMLKTLEEPPEHVQFVLATTDPQKIPVTVLSRCLQFNLKQMPAAAIAERLRYILAEEGIPAEETALSRLARAARGSMRDALSLLDQAIAYGAGKVGDDTVRAMLGAVDDDFLYAILEAVARNDPRAALAVADEIRSRSLSYESALAELASAIHRIALAQSAPAAVAQDGDSDERLLRLAKAIHPEDVQLYYQIALQGRQELSLAPDEYAGFTMTLLRMFAFAPQPPAPQDAASPADASSDRTPVAPSGAAAFDGDWPRLVSALKLSGVARQLAQACALGHYDERLFELRIPADAKHLAEKTFQDKLQAALQEHFGRPVRVSISIGETNGASARDRAVAAIGQDAFVRELIENFDAVVVESSIKPVQ